MLRRRVLGRAAFVRGTTFVAVLILVLALTVALLAPSAMAQQAGNVYRIGLLGWSPRSLYEDRGYLTAFREELHGLGWVEGRNLRIEYRFAEGKADRLSPLLAELDSLKLDLIVTITTTVTKAAAKLIKTTPVVFVVVADPVGSGLVHSLARPGGNLTGPDLIAPELVGKQLELLKEAVPKISRVGVLWEPTNPGVAAVFHQAQQDAPRLGLAIESLAVHKREDFESVFAAMARDRPDALFALTTPLTVRYASQIAEFALKNRLPTMGGRSLTEAGGMMSYGLDLANEFRRAAHYVNKDP